MPDKLGMGDSFPPMTLDQAQGGQIRLPGDSGARYGVILFYRGSW